MRFMEKRGGVMGREEAEEQVVQCIGMSQMKHECVYFWR